MSESKAGIIIRQRAEEVLRKYRESGQQKYINALIYGDLGTGKSAFLATAPKPIWIHSFDPGGSKIREIQNLVESGDCIVDSSFENFDGSDWKKPTVYAAWEKEFEQMKKEGLFEHIGTFCIDSFTKMAEAMMNEIMKENGHKGKTPQIQDYLVQQMAGVQLMGELAGLPCHTIITGHIQRDKNEYTGKIETSMLLFGKMAEKIPLCLDEKYLAKTQDGKDGVSYHIQTQNDGTYKASTRMGGGGVFNKDEVPDFKKLLKRAEKDWEDKPRFGEGGE